LFKSEALPQVAEDIGRRVGASADQVMGFHNNSFMAVSDDPRESPQQPVPSLPTPGEEDRPPETDASSRDVKPV
jgi:hypothetical protein